RGDPADNRRDRGLEVRALPRAGVPDCGGLQEAARGGFPVRERFHHPTARGGLMSASFEEKSVWIQLISMVAVLGSYFVIAARMLSNGVTVVIAYVPLFIVAVIMLVVVLVAGHV